MFQLSSSVRPAGNSASRSSRGACPWLTTLVLPLFLVALCIGPSSLAQSSNPLGALLGKNQPASQTSPAPAGAPAESQPPAAIPLPEVSARSEELARLLRDTTDQLPTREQLDALKATLVERDATMQAKRKEVDTLLAGSPSSMEVREQETYWHVFSTEGAAARKQLLDWANAAQSAVQQLQVLQPVWALTLEENKNSSDLGPTLDVIRNAVKSIQTASSQGQELLRMIVNLQVIAANQHQLALDVVDRLGDARAQLKEHILQRDSLPLWQLVMRRQEREAPDFFANTTARIIGIKSFVQENSGVFVFLAALVLLSLFGAYRLSVRTRGIQPAGEQQARALEIARHWVALGALPPLLTAFLLSPFAPLPLVGLTILLSFFSILVLLPPLIKPRFHIPLYCLMGVYVFNGALIWITLSPSAKREVQFLGFLVAIVLFAYLLRPKRIAEGEASDLRHGLLILGARVALAVLTLSQVANLFGYYKLMLYLAVACIYSTFIALTVFTALRVFTLLFLAALDAPSAERLALVRMHRAGMARWIPRVLQWAGILLWLGATLDLLNVRSFINQSIADLLAFNIAGTSGGVTLGGVLGFFAILLGGYAAASAFRFLFREELLNRFHLKRGLPELISTTLHYLLLLLVFLFAVNAGGVALNKFTVLTGALGVGVGFGLQNIINNFVSGLILQFERPIRVGDVVDTGGGVTGTVTRIGIRSSTVQTFQGAEVIIPNATFISANVTNWTLSESRRRLDLPVGVAYGSDAKLVKELLERPAVQHPDVLTTPGPEAFFMGFGDSALNFELRFWVMQESNTVKVMSQVALEVMRLLAEAGIEIPFPQRDLRLRSVDAQAAAALSGDLAEREENSVDFQPRIKSAR